MDRRVARYLCGVDIEASVEMLGDLLVEAGFERPAPPQDDGALTAISTAIAPLRLPEELETFWRLVDPRTVQASVFPEFALPEFALDSWHRVRSRLPYAEPHNLLLVGYQSWSCMWVELDDTEQRGATLFNGALDTDTFYRRYNRLGDWLDRICELIVSGSVQRVDAPARSYLRVNDPLDSLALAADRDLPPHPLYGARIEFGRDTLSWPAHWQRASGIDPSAAEPRGATHTIAELLASDPETELRATVAGQVVDLGGNSAGDRVRVDDGTAMIDISCANETTPFGLVCGDRFEFDVTVRPGERHVPADVEAARNSTDDPVEQTARVLYARYGGPAGAVATAVRPLR